MKKTLTLFCLFFPACYCLGQSVDTVALGILQKSHDKLAVIGTFDYKLVTQDTMVRNGWPRVIKSEVTGTMRRNKDWLIRFEDLSEWLVRNDTLYKKSSAGTAITYSTSWNSHDLAAFGVHNILGNERPSLRKDIDSMRFVPGTENEKFYVIDVVRKKIDYGTIDLISKRYYNRYWIDKTTFLPARRMMYSKRLNTGKEEVDIYDFCVSIGIPEKKPRPFAFFSGLIVEEKDQNTFDTLKTGSAAPKFSVVNVTNGKTVSHETLRGKVVLLDFWYLSCMPCRILIPKIQRLHEKFKNEDVAIVGVNVRDTSVNEIRKFMKERNIRYTQYYMGKSMMTDYKLFAFPTTMIIGRNGQVKLVEIGEGEDTEQKLAQAIRNELTL